MTSTSRVYFNEIYYFRTYCFTCYWAVISNYL